MNIAIKKLIYSSLIANLVVTVVSFNHGSRNGMFTSEGPDYIGFSTMICYLQDKQYPLIEFFEIYFLTYIEILVIYGLTILISIIYFALSKSKLEKYQKYERINRTALIIISILTLFAIVYPETGTQYVGC